MLNSDVVADTEIIDLLEELRLDEFDTPLQIPEFFERASIFIEEGFKAFQRRKSSSRRKLTAPESQAEREMGGFEWLDSIGFLGYFSFFFNKQFE